MTYLIVRFSTLGSVAMLVPAVTILSNKYIDDKFVVISQKELSAMFAHLPNVVFVKADLSKKCFPIKSVINLYKQITDSYHIDYTIDLQDSKPSRLFRFLMRRKSKVVVIRKQRWRRKYLIHKGFVDATPLLTEFELYDRAFSRAHLDSNGEFECIDVNADAQQLIINQFGTKAAHYQWIGVAPFATYKTNRLPRKQIKEVLTYLNNRKNTRVFLFGAGEVECEVLNQWEGMYDNVISVAGKVSLEQELELMRNLDLMVAMDSANQHLSSLVNLRALTIWCGTHPYAGFYGWNQPKDYCIETETKCRPCTLHGSNTCKKNTFECQNIAPADIINKIEWCLDIEHNKTN